MPRISLWRENHSNDYKFFDNRVREVFTAGGVGIWIHKLLGPVTDSNNTGDATQPVYTNQSEQNIQDLKNEHNKMLENIAVQSDNYLKVIDNLREENEFLKKQPPVLKKKSAKKVKDTTDGKA
mgnify:CR=1 FL=1